LPIWLRSGFACLPLRLYLSYLSFLTLRLAQISDLFQHQFIRSFNCSAQPGGVHIDSLGCLVDARTVASVRPYDPVTAPLRYAGLTGSWINYRYTHNTWQKFGGCEVVVS
jgi:hypothetical protein